MSQVNDDGRDASKGVEAFADTGDENGLTAPSTVNDLHKIEHNEDADNHTETTETPRWRRVYDILFWVPPNCRWDQDQPPKFSMGLNILFAFAGAFTVANLYYNQPILNILARDFDVPYEKVAQIPTVAQAGYAAGLFFLCPLGDLLKRRPFVLSLVLFTSTVSIGLCITDSLVVFSVIQCLVGFTTVTPQLMLPLVGDLAPPNRRAAALSIVVSGFVVGILVARLLSGVMTNYISWRYVYWMSVALQYAIFGSLWLFMPDYPATNKRLNYFKMLWSMFVMLAKHPVLVQASLISYCTSVTFTNFWTVLTFLLAGEPYHYDPVTIGLFALIGISTMFVTPIYGRLVIDRFVPWFSVNLGMLWCMIGVCVGAYTGTFTVAGPIIQAWFNDLGMQTAQIANRSSIYTVEPKGRNRVNTVFMVFTFFGQLTGTSVGARLYAEAGWVGSQSFSVGAIALALIITWMRGPWIGERWIGWHGGLSIYKKDKTSADGVKKEEHNVLRRLNTSERQTQAAERDLEKNTVTADEEEGKGVEPSQTLDQSMAQTFSESDEIEKLSSKSGSAEDSGNRMSKQDR